MHLSGMPTVRAYVKPLVLAAARGDAYLLAEDGCLLFRRHRHETNASPTDQGIAMRSFDIVDP